MTKRIIREDIADIIESKYNDFDSMCSSLEDYFHENLEEYLETLGVELDCIKVENLFIPNGVHSTYELSINVVYLRNKFLQVDGIRDFQDKFFSDDMLRIYTIKKIIA